MGVDKHMGLRSARGIGAALVAVAALLALVAPAVAARKPRAGRADAKPAASAPEAPAAAAKGENEPSAAPAAEPPAEPPPPPKPEVPPDAPTVAARLDRTEARIGDKLVLTVTTVAAAGVPTNLPTELDLQPFELLGGDPVIEEKDLGDGHRSRTFRMDVAAYETGDLAVPPIKVTYIGKDGSVLSRKTEPVPIRISSLIANEPDPQLKEAVEPVTVLQEDLTLVYVAAALVAAAVGGIFTLWLRRRWRERDARRPPPPPRPAHEIALEKLDRLAKSALHAVGDAPPADAELRQFYFELSEILREYLGNRFGFLALEMTTEELVAEVQRRAPRGLVPGELAGWLSGCDLVKFAKLAPPPSEARGALETAIRMVESTRPRPETPAVGVAPGGPGAPKASAEPADEVSHGR
jgi:hypothetical protein